MGIGWILKCMFVPCLCVLKACGFKFDLLGHPVIAHLWMLRSTFCTLAYLFLF